MSVASALRWQRAFNEREAERLAGNVVTTVAADFLRGGQPGFARAFDRRGRMLLTLQRRDGEPLAAFKARAIGEAARTSGASSLVIGGLPDGVDSGGEQNRAGEDLPRNAVVLPEEALHPSQVEAFDLIRGNRRVALVAGRRWGKSALLNKLAVDAALSGKRAGVFAPTYQLMSPLWADVANALQSILGASINRTNHEIRLPNGGHVDFWSVDHTGRAGRGRKYHITLLDEAAHDSGYLTDTFSTAIAPTLLDYDGSIVAASTPNGLEGWFHDIVHDQRHGFAVHHAPTSANPYWSAEGIERLRATMRPEEASQELDALFVDQGGATIFPLHLLLLEDGQPHADDFQCQALGVAIDSNSGKGGEGRDGAAAVVWALTTPAVSVARGSLDGARVVLVDWSIESLAQGGMPAWLQYVKAMATSWFHRLRPLAGPPIAYIEPAGNAYSVIEAARAQGLRPQEIDTKYVAAGKDMRAQMVSPHANVGRMKIGKTALDKRTNYRGSVANHLVRQVTGFRAFDRDAYRREDDLYDAAMYSVLVSLGDGLEQRWSKLKRVS